MSSGVIAEYAPQDRVPLAPLSGATLEGGRVDTSEFAGSVVVINVWGSWCAPCRTEAPVLARVARETAASGVEFVGVNVKDNDAAALAFEQKYAIEYPSLTTAESAAAILAISAVVPDNAVPSTIVLDGQARVAARVIGPVDYSTLKALVEDAAS